jgi:hypothetical protein
MKALIRGLPPSSLLLLLAALAFLIRLPDLFDHFHDWDEAAMMAQAWAVTKGEVLYRDIFQFHPILNVFIFVPFFLLFSPDTAPHAIKFANVLYILSGAVLLYRLVSEWLDNTPAASISAVGFILLFRADWAQSSHGEFYALVPLLAAANLLLCGKEITRPKRLFAGFCFGLAFYLKQTAIFDAVALSAGALWIQRRKEKNFLSDFAEIAGGFLIVTGLISLYFLSFKMWQEAMYSMWLRPLIKYTGLHQETSTSFAFERWSTFTQTIRAMTRYTLAPLTFALGGLIIFARGALKKRSLTRQDHLFLIFTGWLISSLLALTLIGRFYPHYLIQTLPSLLLLASYALNIIKQEHLQGASRAFLTLSMAFGIWSAGKTIPKLSAINWTPARVAQSKAASDFIQAHTSTTDTLFLYKVWNLDIFYLAERLSNNGIYMFIDMVSEHSKDKNTELLKRQEFLDNLPTMIAVDPTGWLFPRADIFFKDIINRSYLFLGKRAGIDFYILKEKTSL